MLVVAAGLIGSPLLAADRDSAAPAAAAAPTTRPLVSSATRPAGDVATLTRLIAQLADDDYSNREAARIALMGLRRSDLGVLRQSVQQSMPLEPGQIIVLRDVVTQVYLAGDAYLPDDQGAGFLGVSLPVWSRPEDRALLTLERGVAVVSRVPGFCAFRMLQNGDVLLSMTTAAGTVELNTPERLSDSVKAVKAGQTITFEVLRQGEVLTVPITLDPRPFNLDNMGAIWLQEFTGRRADQANEVWERDFAPLFAEKLG
jgi:hypothetical protein